MSTAGRKGVLNRILRPMSSEKIVENKIETRNKNRGSKNGEEGMCRLLDFDVIARRAKRAKISRGMSQWNLKGIIKLIIYMHVAIKANENEREELKRDRLVLINFSLNIKIFS